MARIVSISLICFFLNGQNIKLHLGKKKLHKMTRVEKCGTSGFQTRGTHLQKLLQTCHTHIEKLLQTRCTHLQILLRIRHTHIKKLLQTRCTHLQKLLQTRHTHIKKLLQTRHTHIKKLLQTRIPRSTTALEASTLTIRPPMWFE